MKTLMRLLTLAAVALLLAACGGGGGCAGTVNGQNTCTATTSAAPGTTQTAAGMTLFFTNSTATFTPLAQNNVTSTPNTYAVATVLDANGAALANQIVSFSTNSAIAALSSTMALTDASGRAWVRIQPASLTTSGAAILDASSTMAGQTVTASQGYQVGASNVALGTMTVSPASVTALATASVSVPVTVNGVAAAAGQVNVTMQASCGYFNSPGTTTVSVPTGSTGNATATWQSQSSCGGSTVNITATATGAPTPSTGTVTVAAVAPANILYGGATANTLVVSTSTSGTKQSTLTFKVVDGAGTGMGGQAVTFTLDGASSTAGVTLDTTTGTTDGSGNVNVIVSSGSLPTPVSVSASLTATPAMTASSFGLVVTSGKPSQSYTSVSATKLNIEGFSIDGVTTTLTLRTADRMGNPPPANTAVTFSTGYGSVTGACQTDATGACSVTYTTGGTRPANGIVTILATLAGEESFIDNNGNNAYDTGETFDDIGQAYRDDNVSGGYDTGVEQKYGTASGASACPDPTLSVAGTCDGVWTSSILVRDYIRIGLSSDTALITLVGGITGSGFSVLVTDAATGTVGMASGTTVAAAVSPGTGSTCALVSVAPGTVPNQVAPSTHKVTLNNVTCTGTNTSVTVTVTSPSGRATPATFNIP